MFLRSIDGDQAVFSPEGYAQIAERSFLRVPGELPLNVITKQDVARWVTCQESQPSTRTAGATISSKTMKNYHGVLSAVLNEAVDLKYLKSREEFDTLPRYEPDYYRLLLFLVGTGMRWGEATALTWADMDLNAKIPTARASKAWKTGPGGVPVLGPPDDAAFKPHGLAVA